MVKNLKVQKGIERKVCIPLPGTTTAASSFLYVVGMKGQIKTSPCDFLLGMSGGTHAFVSVSSRSPSELKIQELEKHGPKGQSE